MKILVVCQYYYPEPFRLHEVCEALAERGHEITVLTGLPNYPMGIIPEEYKHGKKRDEMLNGVHVIRVNEIPRSKGKIGLAKNYASYMINASFKALYMKKDFDAIFVYQQSPVLMAIPAYIAKWFSRCKKLYIYCLDLWPESLSSLGISEDSLFYKIIRKISIKIYNGASILSYTSGQFIKYFKDDLKLKQKNYKYIPQFADSLFEDVINTEHEGINLVFAGNTGEVQAVDTIIRAAALIKDMPVKFYIVGDGSCYDELRKLAEELKVIDSVIFTGRKPVEEMPKYYAMADAMLVTLADMRAINYTLPGKVQSYMAAGKAIIASANGETEVIIKDAGCGKCTGAHDAEGLAEIIRHLDAAELRTMGKNAKEYYDKNFSKKTHIDMMEELVGGKI